MEDNQITRFSKSVTNINEGGKTKDTTLVMQYKTAASYDKVEKTDLVNFQDQDVEGDHNGEVTTQILQDLMPQVNNKQKWDASMPLQIVYKLALLLHPENIANLRCVATYWNKELTSKEFIKDHLLSQIAFRNISYVYSKSSYLCISTFDGEYTHELMFVSDELQNEGDDVKLEASCHDLILVKVGYDEGSMLLVNPITKMSQLVKHNILGEYAEETDSEDDELQLSNPSKSGPILECVWGLGFDESTQDYIVVKIEYADGHPNLASTGVYSFIDDTWYNIPSPGYRHDVESIHDPSGVYLNGMLYWLAVKDDVGEESLNVIAKFCLNKRVFEEEISLTKGMDDEHFEGLVVLGENIGVWNENCVWMYTGDSWKDIQVDTHGRIILQAIGLYGKDELVLELEEVENDKGKRHLWFFNMTSRTLCPIGNDNNLTDGGILTFIPSFFYPSRI